MARDKNGATQGPEYKELQGFFVIPLSDTDSVNSGSASADPDKRDRIPISAEMLSTMVEQLARRLQAADPEQHARLVGSLVSALPEEARYTLRQKLRSHRNAPGLLKDHPLWDEVIAATKKLTVEEEEEQAGMSSGLYS